MHLSSLGDASFADADRDCSQTNDLKDTDRYFSSTFLWLPQCDWLAHKPACSANLHAESVQLKVCCMSTSVSVPCSLHAAACTTFTFRPLYHYSSAQIHKPVQQFSHTLQLFPRLWGGSDSGFSNFHVDIFTPNKPGSDHPVTKYTSKR